MDFRSTLSVVADYLPSDVENVLAAASAYPVSYTHLDVYKRQLFS